MDAVEYRNLSNASQRTMLDNIIRIQPYLLLLERPTQGIIAVLFSKEVGPARQLLIEFIASEVSFKEKDCQ